MPKTILTPATALQTLLDEYQLNPFAFSKKVSLSGATVRLILLGQAGISIPTALRFAKFFGQCPSFWLDLQFQADMKAAANDKELQAIIKDIEKAKKPSAPKPEKVKTKPAKKTTVADKRKKAAKVPGAKPAARKIVKRK